MPEAKYERDTQRFDCIGLDLNRPYDSVRPGHFPILKNIRVYQQGRPGPRPGLTSLGAVITGKTPIHSVRRLNDPRTSTYTLIVGVQDSLAYGQSPFTQATYAGGNLTFSGNPLALIPYQPEQSPETWMFLADSSPNVNPSPANALATSLKKINISGTVHQIGLPSPKTAPTAALAAPTYKYTDPDFDFEYANNGALQAAWINAGTAAAPTLLTRVATTITGILYDTGTTGWACVWPVSMGQIGVGSIILVNTGGGTAERVIIQETHPGSNATTIASIIYDSGTSGLCSVVLTGRLEEAEVNGVFGNNTKGETNRVLSVNRGPDGTVSIRISTVATYVAGDNVQFLASFRAYFANTHAAAEALDSKAARSNITVGTGTLTRTAAYDFSLLASGVASKPDDYIHISFKTDRPDLISEIKLMFDFDATVNTFVQNYFYAAVRVSDLTPSARSLQTLLATRQTIIQRSLIDEGIATDTNVDTVSDLDQSTKDVIDLTPAETDVTSEQTEPGDSQWSEMRLKLSDFQRVGTDYSRGWSNIAAVRIQVVTTGTVNFDFDDIQLGGGFGPDQSDTGIPYIYRYRARVRSTNARSNPSPPLRGGITPYRQSIVVNPPLYQLATEADVLDIERLGGDIPEWHYVGTVANTGTPAFTDNMPDDIAAGEPKEGDGDNYGLDSYQLWPVKDVPRTGTTGTVAGTTVNDAASNFNTSWGLGTGIIIGGVPYTIYRVISTSRLELFENAGSQSAVAWNVPEPILESQPFPCLWGPVDSVLFGCGDNVNPQRLYFTAVNSEGCRVSDFIDITSPSEPLMNGCVYNGRIYVWSSERFFQIFPTGDVKRYTYREIPAARGLFARWAFSVGPLIYYLSRDGIYETAGGDPKSITDDWLYPLFPTEAQAGVAAADGVVGAPDITSGNAANLRLNFAVTFLYFDYRNVSATRQTLVWSLMDSYEESGWFFDTYAAPPVLHYGEEGSGVMSILFGGGDATTALLYRMTGNSDNGTAIDCQIRTPARDQGAPRENKLYGDIMIDCNPAGVNVVCVPYTNNYGTSYPSTTLNHNGRDIKPVNIQAGAWTTARNVAIDITFSVSTSAKPYLFIWEPRWTFESAPISAFSWEISPTTFGLDNFKHFGIGKITHVSSADLSLVVTIDNSAQTAITITNSGSAYKETIFRFPVYKAKLYKLRLSSASEFRLSGRDSFVEVKEWGSPGPYNRFRPFSDFSAIEG